MAAPAVMLLTGLSAQSMAQAQAPIPTSSTAQPLELLADKEAWQLDDTAKFVSNGVLQLAAADEKPEEPQAVRRVNLPPASAWEAGLRFSPLAEASAAGLLLISADERWISVMLNPAKRGIQVRRGDPINDRQVAMLAGEKLTAWADSGDQVLTVRGDGGKLQVWLNGKKLWYGSPYDFEPQSLGLRSEGGGAQFHSLGWRVDGVDGRLARLSGTVLIPGRPPLLEEKFGSAAMDIASGLWGRITGKKQETGSAGGWPQNWRDAGSVFTRDTSGKRLYLEGLRDANGAFAYVFPGIPQPLREATVAVTARVKLRATPVPLAAAGLYLEDRWHLDKPGQEYGNAVYVNLAKGQLRLDQFNAKTGTWTVLQSYLWPHKDKEVELRLVARGSRAWVFVDRHLVMSEALEDMNLGGISGGGLRVEGLGAIEASSFRIDEL